MPTPIVVSYSELDAARQCPHKHALAYRQRWVPKTLSPALDKGQRWHLVMETHYRALQAGSSDTAVMAAVAEVLAGMPDDEITDLIAWMYAGYLECYGRDPHWEIQGVEAQYLIRLPTRLGRPSRFWLRMRADLIVIETMLASTVGTARAKKVQRWRLVDHKSGRNLPTDKELDIDDQFGLYTYGLRREGLPIFSAVHSAARTEQLVREMTLDERFRRTNMHRTDRELETIAREAFVTARNVYRMTEEEAPRAPDSDRCRWRCPYTEPCLVGRKNGPRSEQNYLESIADRLTEQEQLALRGYGDEPMQPGGPI